MKEEQVVILLATYNGAQFLEQQLQSIINQSYTNWTLLIHDDGSSDETLTKVNEFIQKDNRICLLADGVRGLGAAGNFLHLLSHADQELIAFCDQDDIWLDHKLEDMVNAIKDVEGPAMFYCNAFPYKDGHILTNDVTTYQPRDLKGVFFLNGGIQGCATIFNKALKDILIPYPEYVCMHDHLITLGAATFGRIAYINKSLMYYRLHDNNTTGDYEFNLLKRVKRFFTSRKAVIDASHYKAIKSFYDRYQADIPEAKRAYFLSFFRLASSKTLLKRILIVIQYRFSLGGSMSLLILKMIVRKML